MKKRWEVFWLAEAGIILIYILLCLAAGRVLIQFQEVKNWLRNINMNVVFSVKSIIGFFAFRCIDPPAEGNDLFFAIVRQWPV